MANRYWTFVTQLVAGTLAKAGDVNTQLSGVSSGLDDVEAEMDNKIGLSTPEGQSLTLVENAAARANKLLGFDASGAIKVATAATSLNSVYANNANGNPTISDTPIAIHSIVAQSAWESIGPTLSGADNETTVLDGLPDGINWIEVKIRLRLIYASKTLEAMSIYARDADGAESVSSANKIMGYYRQSITAPSFLDNYYTNIKIPVNSSKMFELFYFDDLSSPAAIFIDMYLTGYGWNN